MAKRKYRRRSKSKNSLANSFMRRAVRSVLAIVLLAAFVLGIAYGVNKASKFNVNKIAHFAAPYLSKIGLSEAQIGEVAGEVIKRATDVGIEGKVYFDEMVEEERKAIEEEPKIEESIEKDNTSSASAIREAKINKLGSIS